jgi:hypothetical protein
LRNGTERKFNFRLDRCDGFALHRTMSEKLHLLGTEDTKTRCKIGQGPACCIFLTFTPNEGFTCERGGPLEAQLLERKRQGIMVADSINCSGAPDFMPEGI